MNRNRALWTTWWPLWSGVQAKDSGEVIRTPRVTDKLTSCVRAHAASDRSRVKNWYLKGNRIARKRSSSIRRTAAVSPVADHQIKYICGQKLSSFKYRTTRWVITATYERKHVFYYGVTLDKLPLYITYQMDDGREGKVALEDIFGPQQGPGREGERNKYEVGDNCQGAQSGSGQ